MISKLDFNIVDTHSFKTLGLVDTSIYNPDIQIENISLEITPPGFKYPAKPFFLSKSLNIYNSNNVGLTKAQCEEELIDLPDGLWKVKYSICPNDKLFLEKVFLRINKLECKFTQAFLTLDLSNCDTEIEEYKLKQLEEIDLYIQGALAASNISDFKLTTDLYKKANNMLDRFIELNGGCGC